MKNSVASSLDAIDYRILRELSREGRISDVDLGERIHLSSTAVARRRKILEEKQVIVGYSANLDLARLGFSIVAIVTVEIASQAEHVLNEFEAEVIKCPSVSFCGFISGDTDFMMIIHVRSFDDYDAIYRRELSKLPHVRRIRSSFLMREVAHRSTAPVVLEQPSGAGES